MSDEMTIDYTADIGVDYAIPDVLIELTQQGPQGPSGEKGDTGTVTPEMMEMLAKSQEQADAASKHAATAAKQAQASEASNQQAKSSASKAETIRVETQKIKDAFITDAELATKSLEQTALATQNNVADLTKQINTTATNTLNDIKTASDAVAIQAEEVKTASVDAVNAADSAAQSASDALASAQTVNEDAANVKSDREAVVSARLDTENFASKASTSANEAKTSAGEANTAKNEVNTVLEEIKVLESKVEGYATSAAGSLDDLKDRWVGCSSVPPLDPVVGTLYLNTSTNPGIYFTYDGSQWQAIPGISDTQVNQGYLAFKDQQSLTPDQKLQAIQNLGLADQRYNWIINGAFTVNNRNGLKEPALGEYGYDRWKGNDWGHEQIVEALPAGTYTLWWDGGGLGYINGIRQEAPIVTEIKTSGNQGIIVPLGATNACLVAGSVTHTNPFTHRNDILENILCQRYFYKLGDLDGYKSYYWTIFPMPNVLQNMKLYPSIKCGEIIDMGEGISVETNPTINVSQNSLYIYIANNQTTPVMTWYLLKNVTLDADF